MPHPPRAPPCPCRSKRFERFADEAVLPPPGGGGGGAAVPAAAGVAPMSIQLSSGRSLSVSSRDMELEPAGEWQKWFQADTVRSI